MQTGNLKSLDPDAVGPDSVHLISVDGSNEVSALSINADARVSNTLSINTPSSNNVTPNSPAPHARGDLDLYQVDLGFFSGPMDLLLHLVSLKEVPIEDVSMAEVLEQYLAVVNMQAQELDLEKASEYLVIAATLMVIKSRALLPAEVEENNSEEAPDEQYLQFFEDLRARLKAFEQTRCQAQALIETPQLGLDTFTRVDKGALQVPPEMVAEGESINRIGGLFYALVRRVGGMGKSIRISVEPVSVVSSMMKIVDALRNFTMGVGNNLPSTFSSILKKAYQKEEGISLGSRNVVLGSFIALLELAKRGMVSLKQDYGSEDIYMTLRMRDAESQNSETDQIIYSSEFDEPASAEIPKAVQGDDASEISIAHGSSSVLILDDYRRASVAHTGAHIGEEHSFGNKFFEEELKQAQNEQIENTKDLRVGAVGNG